MAKSEKPTIRVTQVRSVIGYNRKQADIVRSLGLRRIGHTVEVIDHEATRGMVKKVRHLVSIVD